MTELSKTSIKAAKYNLEANGVENIKVAQATAEDFSAAWLGKQPLKNLQKERIDLGEYDFRTILVDPPRAGLDDATVKLAQEFDRIVYISCNPDTLHANLEVITNTHTIERFALFDQFPYVHHTECGVFLKKKAANGHEA